MISPVNAVSPLSAPAAGVGAAKGIGGDDAGFGALLDQLVTQTAQSLGAGEAAAGASVTGAASAQDVVEKVMSAEQSLQIAIGIRDKIVNAYSEISRMTI